MQTLQYLVFPEGILYNKEADEVLTPKINILFGLIPSVAPILIDNKKDNLGKDCLLEVMLGY